MLGNAVWGYHSVMLHFPSFAAAVWEAASSLPGVVLTTRVRGGKKGGEQAVCPSSDSAVELTGVDQYSILVLIHCFSAAVIE